MLALTHDRFGEPVDVIRVTEIPKPEPGSGEVRLRLRRSPIHNHDLATIRGVYGYKPVLPAVGGTEMLGDVDALGDGVQHLKTGMRVAALSPSVWSEYTIVPAGMAVPVPDTIADDMGAQLLAMPLSAVVLFDELRTEPGMWIAQTAAGGAVGRIFMRIAQEREVNIVNLVRSERAAESLHENGARHVVVTSGDGWQQRVRELTGGIGLARIIDSVAGPQVLDLQRLLAPGGEIVVFGGLSGAAIKLDPGLMISLQCVVRGFWMSAWIQRASREQRTDAIRRIFEMAARGALPLPVAAVYPLRDWASALAAAEEPGRGGKVLFST